MEQIVESICVGPDHYTCVTTRCPFAGRPPVDSIEWALFFAR
jgi:hypothetical protein